MEKIITIWEAIAEMRKLTAEKTPFTITYMSCDLDRQTSQGVVRVNRALLRPQTHVENNRNADHMLNYLDRDLNLPRRFYQIALMEFNGYITVPELEEQDVVSE